MNVHFTRYSTVKSLGTPSHSLEWESMSKQLYPYGGSFWSGKKAAFTRPFLLFLVRVGQLYFQVTMTRMILINIPSSSHAITSCVLTTDPVRGFFLQCSWPSPPIPHATISFFPRRCKLLVYTLTHTLWSHVIVLVCHPKMFLSTTHPLRSKSSLHWLPLCCRI